MLVLVHRFFVCFLRTDSKMGHFPHRQNHDGTFDSICPECFKTVASDLNEAKLRRHEKRHVCEAGSLHKPETKKKIRPKAYLNAAGHKFCCCDSYSVRRFLLHEVR